MYSNQQHYNPHSTRNFICGQLEFPICVKTVTDVKNCNHFWRKKKKIILVFYQGSSFPSLCENTEGAAAGGQPCKPCCNSMNGSLCSSMRPNSTKCWVFPASPVLRSRFDDSLKQPDSNHSKHVVNHLQEREQRRPNCHKSSAITRKKIEPIRSTTRSNTIIKKWNSTKQLASCKFFLHSQQVSQQRHAGSWLDPIAYWPPAPWAARKYSTQMIVGDTKLRSGSNCLQKCIYYLNIRDDSEKTEDNQHVD